MSRADLTPADVAAWLHDHLEHVTAVLGQARLLQRQPWAYWHGGCSVQALGPQHPGEAVGGVLQEPDGSWRWWVRLADGSPSPGLPCNDRGEGQRAVMGALAELGWREVGP